MTDHPSAFGGKRLDEIERYCRDARDIAEVCETYRDHQLYSCFAIKGLRDLSGAVKEIRRLRNCAQVKAARFTVMLAAMRLERDGAAERAMERCFVEIISLLERSEKAQSAAYLRGVAAAADVVRNLKPARAALSPAQPAAETEGGERASEEKHGD